MPKLTTCHGNTDTVTELLCVDETPSYVALRLGHSPDEDLVLMTQSRVFVEGGGGFSSLAAALRKRVQNSAVRTASVVRRTAT